MSRIELKNIDKHYGDNHVLKDVNLTIEDGEFMTFLGPSGCGKTTMLRVVSGLEDPQNGVMLMDGKEIINAKEAYFAEPGKRGLNLVFQSYALWPHMTVFDNVAFGLEIKSVSENEIKKKVMDALNRMQIEEFSDRYPSELSGGQQQRVAIARAIVTEPEVLLLDEPLSNLDAKLRVEMRSVLKQLHKELKTTIIYVTHDQTEAMTMSSRISIFFEGVLEQTATPLEIYQKPISMRVAEFIGSPAINFIDGKGRRIEEGLEITSSLGTVIFKEEDLTPNFKEQSEFDCVLGVRPELIKVSHDNNSNGVDAKIVSFMPAGSETLLYLDILGDKSDRLLSKLNGTKLFDNNEIVKLDIDFNTVNVFDKKTGHLIKYATGQ